MGNPFKISGPAQLGFSGGRTSGKLLYEILNAHDGQLPKDVIVTFANTGKERPETLAFVDKCQTRWGVKIYWLEYRPTRPFYAEVNFATADRTGKPFEMMVDKERHMPNPTQRLCTKNLKIKTRARFTKAFGLRNWTAIIGIRADEQRRIAKIRASEGKAQGYSCADVAMPLVEAGITKPDVLAWWKEQPFNLAIDDSNCDLCYLLPSARRVERMRQWPGSEKWWIEMERRRVGKEVNGVPFRANGANYEALAAYAHNQQRLHLPIVSSDSQCVVSDDDGLGECFCHD